MVRVLENALDCDRDAAVAMTVALINARVDQFQRVVNLEIPALYREYDVDDEVRGIIDRRVLELQDWLAGVLNWHVKTRRYPETGLRQRFSRTFLPSAERSAQRPAGLRPTGLGTAAAQLSYLRDRRALTKEASS